MKEVTESGGQAIVRYLGTVAFGFLASFALAGPACASLIAAHYANLGSPGGEITRIDPSTGQQDLIGFSGVFTMNSLTIDSQGRLFSVGFLNQTDQALVEIDPKTGAAAPRLIFDPFVSVSGLAFSPDDELYMVGPGTSLFEIDANTGAIRTVGRMGPTMGNVQSIEFAPDGTLYGWSVLHGLIRINTSTGLASNVNGFADGTASIQAIAFDSQGNLFGARAALYEIDPSTGSFSLRSGLDFNGIRGLAFIPELLELDIDIRPWSDINPVNPFSRGVIPVAILGSDSFDVADVDVTTLAFGPEGAAPAHRQGGHPWDVNGDGFTDLLSHYRTQETRIAVGDTEACVTGATLDGTPLEGCDFINTEPNCGNGYAVALVVPPLVWTGRRMRRGRR